MIIASRVSTILSKDGRRLASPSQHCSINDASPGGTPDSGPASTGRNPCDVTAADSCCSE
jgi:hypothetical protein